MKTARLHPALRWALAPLAGALLALLLTAGSAWADDLPVGDSEEAVVDIVEETVVVDETTGTETPAAPKAVAAPCPPPFPTPNCGPRRIREVPTRTDLARSVSSCCGPSWEVPRCTPPSCDCCPKAQRQCGYGGITAEVFPGLGVGVEFGRVFSRGCNVDWSWEVHMHYQDLYDGFNGVETLEAGKWWGGGVGVKASLNPNSRSHPTFRAGLAWYRANGDVDNSSTFSNRITELDIGSIPKEFRDYWGVYAGVGWEFEIGSNIRTGPEVRIFTGWNDSGDFAYTPGILWHFIINL